MVEGQKLLVVDDEEAICEGCRRIFSRQGFHVEKTSDAKLGLNMAEENDYAAILLDIKMPTMTGIEFLEHLRTRRPTVPVILMTGYPSVPSAISAVRLGAAGYVTKPFTPEEISQAVRQHLRRPGPATDAAEDGASSESWTPAAEGFHFWRNAWFQPGEDGTARVGAMVPRSQTAQGASMRLPRVGEVLYQGLPMASLDRNGQPSAVLPAPVSGIVVAVNERLAKPTAPAGGLAEGSWIAMVSPTRLDEETKTCTRRRVILLSAKPAAAREQQAKLAALGCQIRVAGSVEELASPLHDDLYGVLVMDAASFGQDGPAMVTRINAAAPTMKIVVAAPADSPLEPVYRARRIFYYAVEPIADDEIVEILESVFDTPEAAPKKNGVKLGPAPIATLNVVNRNGTKVRLMPAPELLQRDEGLGLLIRQKLLSRLVPIETLLGESPITPSSIMEVAGTCDRVVVLLARDMGRLPGTLVRDTKSEFISVDSAGAACVTTLVVQPESPDAGLKGLGARELEALAEHIVNDLGAY